MSLRCAASAQTKALICQQMMVCQSQAQPQLPQRACASFAFCSRPKILGFKFDFQHLLIVCFLLLLVSHTFPTLFGLLSPFVSYFSIGLKATVKVAAIPCKPL